MIDPKATGTLKVTVHQVELPPAAEGQTLAGAKAQVLLRLGARAVYTDARRPPRAAAADAAVPVAVNQAFQFEVLTAFDAAGPLEVELLLEAAGARGEAPIGRLALPFVGPQDRVWLPLGPPRGGTPRAALAARLDKPGVRCPYGRALLSLAYAPAEGPGAPASSSAEGGAARRRRKAAPTSVTPRRPAENSFTFDEDEKSKKKKTQLALEIFTAAWVVGLVYAVLYTHFQYLYSSQRFFVMDAEDELCLSLNKGAAFTECKVFDGGPTALFSAVAAAAVPPEGGGEKMQGPFKMLLESEGANKGKCLNVKGTKLLVSQCQDSSSWEFAGDRYTVAAAAAGGGGGGKVCLGRRAGEGGAARPVPCASPPAAHTSSLKLVAMYDSGNTYLASSFTSLQKSRFAKAEIEFWNKLYFYCYQKPLELLFGPS